MADERERTEPSGAEKMFGDFAPALVHFTDDVLFGEAWRRPQLSPKERSLVTVARQAGLPRHLNCPSRTLEPHTEEHRWN